MTRQQPPLDPERARKAVRVRSLTNPRGAMCFSQARERIERERRARRAVFLAATSAFVASFGAIVLRDGPALAPAADAQVAPPAAVAGSAPRLALAIDPVLPGNPDRPVIPLPVATATPAVVAAKPTAAPPRPQVVVSKPARRSHVRTQSS